MKKLVIIVMAIAVLLPTVIFANGQGESSDAKPQTVKLTYVNWEEGVAWTHVVAAILEDEYGCKVELTAADVAPAISSVANGDQDFFMEGWLPNLHTVYTEGTDIVKIQTIYKDGVVGLIVPKYMADEGVTKISDLAKPEVAKKLDYKITGIDAGAGMMIKCEEEIIPKYGLDEAGIQLLPSSGPAMLAAMDAAIKDHEYIVGMGWQPHSMFGRYDLVILEQDKDIIYAPDDIFILGRPGVEEELPEITAFMKNVFWTNETIGPLMVYIADSDKNTLEAAREWKNANPDVWQDWVK
ncbi:MAG: glycine betaine ABC transporter substrate-binding protein [Spirochaetales bacterium]|nr:glycine betaine ABC transporter substrate-binding protein [Spirochaetales bacterium]